MRYANSYAEKRAFGEALRRKRLSKNLSQADLASLAGAAATSISKYEYSGMGVTMLISLNIVDALDWSIDEWCAEAKTIYDKSEWKHLGERGRRKQQSNE